MRRGYSLIEVLVATFLLALAVLGLVSAHLYAVRAEREGLGRYDSGAAAGMILAGIESDLRKNPDDFHKSYAVSARPVPDLSDVVYSVDESDVSPRLRKFTVTVTSGAQEFKLWTLVYDATR